MKTVTDTLLSAIRQVHIMIVAAPFWLMAFVALLMRLFMIPPVGALLALTMGVIWCLGNMPRVDEFCRNIRNRYTAWRRGYEQKSLWFDNVGRDQIIDLMDRLSASEVCYCDLAAEINMPPASHWYAISRELNKMGVLTQISPKAFYVAWKLPYEEAA